MLRVFPDYYFFEVGDGAARDTAGRRGSALTSSLVRPLSTDAPGAEPDGSGATSAPTYVSGGAPVVAIDFSRYRGLLFGPSSGGSQLLGVAVDDAGGNGVTLNADAIPLNDDYIGLNLAGAAAGNSANGVLVWTASSGNFIGLNDAGTSGVVANVISGNGESGIVLDGSSGNTLVDNRIGTNAADTAAIPNGGDGLWITQKARGNEIGGTLRSVIPRNTFSGNAGYGVVITGRAYDNHVFRSFIGTQLLGVKALGNKQGGVLISGDAHANLIGLATLTPADLISGNTGIGVTLTSGTQRNSVINNYIGLNRLDHFLRNSGAAVVNAGHDNTIRGNWTRAAPH